MDDRLMIRHIHGLMTALLSANEIRLTYGYQNLLDGVTLAVGAGEKIGMVGRNGCGKTSLLKILSGQSAADSGEIARRRSLRIGYLPQEFELDPDLSVQENIAAGAADVDASGERPQAERASRLDRERPVEGLFLLRLRAGRDGGCDERRQKQRNGVTNRTGKAGHGHLVGAAAERCGRAPARR